jgi:hypothetical protein
LESKVLKSWEYVDFIQKNIQLFLLASIHRIAELTKYEEIIFEERKWVDS